MNNFKVLIAEASDGIRKTISLMHDCLHISYHGVVNERAW